MPIQFIDLKKQYSLIEDRIQARIKAVLDSGAYVMGPEIGELEKILAEYVGVRHALAVSSGTDALVMALMALGIGPGDAVFVPPFSFIATASAVALTGATPVFTDIDPETFNMDPARLEAAITALKNNDRDYPLPANATGLVPRAVVTVDLYGLPADFGRIAPIAKDHGLFVIEDAAQSFGGEFQGKKACSLGHVGCTSFYPAKPLGCYGDGGMCFTDDLDLYRAMHSIRVHGQGADQYDNVRLGINGRLDTIQAAVLLTKFEIFPDELGRRKEVAESYQELLADADVVLPREPEGFGSAWALYTVLARDPAHREALRDSLAKNGIPAPIYYARPLHLQPLFKGMGYKPGDFPVVEDVCERVFSLPMHPYLSEEDRGEVARAVLAAG